MKNKVIISLLVTAIVLLGSLSNAGQLKLRENVIKNLPFPTPDGFVGNAIDSEISFYGYKYENPEGCKKFINFNENMEPLCEFTYGGFHVYEKAFNTDQAALVFVSEEINQHTGGWARISYVYLVMLKHNEISISQPKIVGDNIDIVNVKLKNNKIFITGTYVGRGPERGQKEQIVIEFNSKDINEAVKVGGGKDINNKYEVSGSNKHEKNIFAYFDMHNLRHTCNYVSIVFDTLAKFEDTARQQNKRKEIISTFALELNGAIEKLSKINNYKIVFSNLNIDDMKKGKKLELIDIPYLTEEAKQQYMAKVNSKDGFKFISSYGFYNIDNDICKILQTK